MNDENPNQAGDVQDPAGDVQDPAEQYQVNTAVETESQPEPTGSAPVTVAPSAPEPATETTVEKTETPAQSKSSES